MTIRFDSEREMTLREAVLAKRIVAGDLEALVDLVILRSREPRPTRGDIEALPMSEVVRLTEDLGSVLTQAAALARKFQLH